MSDYKLFPRQPLLILTRPPFHPPSLGRPRPTLCPMAPPRRGLSSVEGAHFSSHEVSAKWRLGKSAPSRYFCTETLVYPAGRSNRSGLCGPIVTELYTLSHCPSALAVLIANLISGATHW